MLDMNTTELFKFRFVDREYERKIINNFFLNKSDKTLWIKGDSGLGKTTFFNYMYDNWNSYSLCYVNIKTDASSIDIISEFIIQLQNNCGIDFLSQLKSRYKKFHNEIYKNTKDISDILFPKISSIVSVLLDLSYTVITVDGENKNSIEIVTDYIRTILHNKKMCICIDNFSRCDLETANIFFQIFKTFIPEKYFRSCIITTSEELQFDLQNAIFHNLPYTEIRITELKEYSYFGQILEPIFELDNIEKDDLEYIYQKCNGSPQKLSTIISKLLEKNGIIIRNSAKAKIDKNVLYSILQGQHIIFKEEDFSPAQKWVLFSYLCFSEEIDVIRVRNCALFIANKFFLFDSFDERLFNQELLNLIENKILKYNANNTISSDHDSEYRDLLDIFENSQFKFIFQQYAYEFLLVNFPEEQKLLCRHAREINNPEWKNMNFKYGKFLAHSKQYYDAQKTFMYLNNYLPEMHVMQILFIAINSYETGNYQLTINQLQLLQPERLCFRRAKYYYYFYLGKSYNNLGQVAKGAEILEKALVETQIGSKEYANTLNVLHMYYLELPEKRCQAYQFFTEIKDNYKDKYPQIWANTIRGCHNFLDNNESLVLLNEAENVLENELEKAFVKTTIGFVYIRENKLDQAEAHFEAACKVIKRLKIHEYSYAMNNFAICHMLKEEYQKAKDILLEALLWNRTDYGKLAIQCHLLACTVCLNQMDEATDYYQYLNEYLINHYSKDPIVKRKLYLNLAIASRKMHKYTMEQTFLKQVKPYIKDSSSEWRYYTLLESLESFHKPRPVLKYQLVTDFEPWFLVYAHD